MSARQTLPNRRPCETVEFDHDGIRYVASIGRFRHSGAISEIFMHGGKTGSAAEIAAHDGAIILAIGNEVSEERSLRFLRALARVEGRRTLRRVA
jgi:hypothetical protein